MNATSVDAGGVRDVLERAVAACSGTAATALSSLPTNRSRKPSLSMSVHTAVCVLVAGFARPLATVTSVNVPSQLFRSSDLRCGDFPPAAQHQDVHAAVVVVVGLHDVQPAQLVAEAGLRPSDR